MSATPDLRTVEINAFLSQADTLANLVSHPAWFTYIGLLRDMRQTALEELAQGSQPADFRYWQGVAATLAEIIDRPDRIITAAAEFQRTEESETKAIRADLRAAIGMGIDREGDI